MNENEQLNERAAENAAENEANPVPSTQPGEQAAENVAENGANAAPSEQASDGAAEGEVSAEPKAEAAQDKKKGEKLTGKKKVLKEIREWVLSLAAALLVVALCRTYLFMPIRVDGSSMYPTLNSGDRLGVTAYDVRFQNKLQRGDVVICHYPGRTSRLFGLITVKTDFVKRIVGMPGDTVSRVSGVTYVNGEALDPSRYSTRTTIRELDGKFYLNGQEVALSEEDLSYFSRNHLIDYEYVLGEDEYFVVGDNRYNSHDSRWWNGPNVEMNVTNDTSGDIGPITEDMILGRAKFVFWPLDDIRGVETDPTYVDPNDR